MNVKAIQKNHLQQQLNKFHQFFSCLQCRNLKTENNNAMKIINFKRKNEIINKRRARII